MPRSLTPRRSQASPSWTEPRRGLLEEMEQLVGRMWDDADGGWFQGRGTPSLDLSETDTAVEVKVDVPGMKAEEIDIQFHGNMLTVSGEHEEEKEEKDKTYHRVERRKGRFSRAVSIPCPVEEDEVAAEYKDGVLNITLPKTEEAKARKITVKR